jgi:hypothetical protein
MQLLYVDKVIHIMLKTAISKMISEFLVDFRKLRDYKCSTRDDAQGETSTSKIDIGAGLWAK